MAQQDYLPALQKLVSHLSGSKKNGCAVVIPSADAVDLVERHLKLLSVQDYQEFDIILIGKLPKNVPAGLNVLNYQEAVPLGSSGGFGVGKVLAYSLGYEFIINADVDAFPESKSLVGRLVSGVSQQGKCVMPKSISDEGGKVVVGSSGPNQYGAVNREVIGKAGFEYFRLFRGAEDHDLYERLSMLGLVAVDDSVSINHKNRNFNYIELQKFRGAKYTYYKKSAVIVKLLLARFALRHLMPIRAARYAADAFFDVVKTQLFYSRNADVRVPIYQAALLRMDGMIFARTTTIPTMEERQGMVGLTLCNWDEKKPSSVGFRGGASNALSVLRCVFSRCDYFEPTDLFLEKRSVLLPLLIHLRPVKYTDGKIYNCGMGWIGFGANALLTVLLCPFILSAVLYSVLLAPGMLYPVTVQNLAPNLEKFAAYVNGYKKAADNAR